MKYLCLWVAGAGITHVLLYQFTESIRDQLDYPVLTSGLLSIFCWPAILPILLLLR